MTFPTPHYPDMRPVQAPTKVVYHRAPPSGNPAHRPPPEVYYAGDPRLDSLLGTSANSMLSYNGMPLGSSASSVSAPLPSLPYAAASVAAPVIPAPAAAVAPAIQPPPHEWARRALLSPFAPAVLDQAVEVKSRDVEVVGKAEDTSGVADSASAQRQLGGTVQPVAQRQTLIEDRSVGVETADGFCGLACCGRERPTATTPVNPSQRESSMQA